MWRQLCGDRLLGKPDFGGLNWDTDHQVGSTSTGLSRSNSFNDPSSRTEAALRAQLIELRRELAKSQQEVEKSQTDLQQRQELLRSAAGEATVSLPGLQDQCHP